MSPALLLTAALAAPPPPVVGGEPLSDGERPEVGAVYFDQTVGCTAVLVAPEVALTAAHCSAATAVQLDGADYERGGERIEVAEVIVHPEWESTYDLAVLKLASAASVSPAPLAQGCVIERALSDGAEVALVGYGATDRYGNVSTTVLHQATAEVIDHDCDSLERGCREAVSPGGELIAGGEGVDTCIGDSGGPLYLSTPWGEFVAGITSRAVTDTTAFCEGGGIYVRPDAALDWLQQAAGVRFEAPDCPAVDTAVPGADTGGEDKSGRCGCAAGGWLWSPLAAPLALLIATRRRRR